MWGRCPASAVGALNHHETALRYVAAAREMRHGHEGRGQTRQRASNSILSTMTRSPLFVLFSSMGRSVAHEHGRLVDTLQERLV